MRTTLRAALALAGVLAVAACTENPYAPDLAPQGEARFTYSGDRTGEFVGSGRLNRRNPNSGAWAVGATGTENGAQVLSVIAQERRADALANALLLDFVGVSVGTTTCTAATPQCPFAGLFVMGTQPFSDVVEAQYAGDVGTFTVSSITEDRAQGTFSMTLTRVGTGTTPPTMQINGSFDVPLNVTD